MTALTEATAAERAYQRRADAILRSVDNLTTEQVRAMLAIVADVRRGVVDDLSRIPQDAGKWPSYRLKALLTELDQAAEEIGRRYGRSLADGTRKAWDTGARFAPDALGIDVGLIAIDRGQLEAAMQLQADLVRRVTQDFRTRAAAEITRAVMGGQSPYQATQAVQKLLSTQRARAGMGPLAAQAERIVRTEIMGAFSLADAARTPGLMAELPGLRKWWDAVSDGRTRPEHAAAERRYQPGGSVGPIALDKDFVVGGERARMPHDPRLSAGQRVKCRCIRRLWMPEWGA